MNRTILHLDLDAFFCAVEEQANPALRGVPFAVGGRPDERGVVASCSYPARRYGVHSAMPMSQALRLCPDLVVVSHRHGEYGRVSREVMKRLNALTPLVEQISIDEAFFDITGLAAGGERIARQLQSEIREELNLPCSFGVATNKLVAKIANNIGKDSRPKDGPPNAITIVPPGQEAAFIAPLPIRELWGVGPRTAERLAQMNVHTIGDLARMSDAELLRLFGKNGLDLAGHARGIDDRPIETEQEAKSISKELTFTRDVSDGEILRRALSKMCDGVGFRLRRSQLTGTTVKLKIRWSDFTTLTRQSTTSHPIDQDAEIYSAGLYLFEQVWMRGRPVRLLGAGVSGFGETGRQLELWQEETSDQSRRLQSTLDELKDRFGEDAIQRGTHVRPQKRPNRRD